MEVLGLSEARMSVRQDVGRHCGDTATGRETRIDEEICKVSRAIDAAIESATAGVPRR
jgi:hypothetical protein